MNNSTKTSEKTEYNPCPVGACPKVPHNGNCGCKCHAFDNNAEEWKESFRKLWGGYPRTKKENTQGLDSLIEDFISNLLSLSRQNLLDELKEEIEGMRKKEMPILSNEQLATRREPTDLIDILKVGYNTALSDISDLLNKKK